MRKLQNILVTGGCGFIGTNFIRYLLEQTDFDGRIINLDLLTYAGNPENLVDIESKYGPARYRFVQADIRDAEAVRTLLSNFAIDTVVHFAAESHVDRSIMGPSEFITTNVMGTFSLLDAARIVWKDRDDVVFHHVSTDEVYGSLDAVGRFTEDSPYDPHSPYSASKASSDHLVRAYGTTYGLPFTLSNCSNNYGPYQFPEKLIPLMISNMLEGKNLPIYGDGKNVRDWLYVDDHAAAIWRIISKAKDRSSYNVGGDNELSNLELLNDLIEVVAHHIGASSDLFQNRIVFIADRPGHDRRYAIDCEKIKRELAWKQDTPFSRGLDRTVEWYIRNSSWVERVKTGEYRKWIEKNYKGAIA